MARIIEGKVIAADIQSALRRQLAQISHSSRPRLATVLVGDRKDSQTYLRLKRVAAESLGIQVEQLHLPQATEQRHLVSTIQGLNNNPNVDGILVQLPLPAHMDSAAVISTIHPTRDVDGVHPTNVGLLHTKGCEPFFKPCTPLGIMELLGRHGVSISGKRAVVIGRSNIVGQPIAKMLDEHNATVTTCNPHTSNKAEVVRTGDIVVSACGQPEMVRGDWIKPGAVVIDVGINPIPDSSKRRGYRLVGDVCFEEGRQVASLITPVPGGVGPMTIAMLMSNMVHAFRLNRGHLGADQEQQGLIIPASATTATPGNPMELR